MWLAERILNYLLGRAVTAVGETLKDAEQERERGKVNGENAKRYEEAVERKDRIRAATDLLNRRLRAEP